MTPYETVRNALNEGADDEKLLKIAQRNKPVLDYLIGLGIKDAIRSHIGDQRDRILSDVGGNEKIVAASSHGPSGRSPSQRLAFLSGEFSALLDYPLYGGTPLGDAERGDILISAEQHEKTGTSHMLKAKWQRSIASMMPEHGTVRQVLSPDDLRQISQSAPADQPSA